MPDDILSQFRRTYNSPIETYRQVATPTDRDNIPSGVRWEGMIVHVISEDASFILIGGIGNGDWQLLGGIQDAPIDGQTYGRKDGDWELIPGGGVDWGDITGTLSAQTDLQSALDAKAMDSSVVHKTGLETITGDKNFNNSYTRFNAVIVGGNGPEPYISLDKRSDDSHVTNSFGIFAFNNSGNLVIGTPQDPPGGFTNLNYVFDSLGLSSDRTYILPDANGTVALQTAASGSFTTSDSKTVTVVNGIITSIV